MISVIVPVYNEEKHVERCIQSVLMQTYDDFELLLVDDGSKDASGEICDKYADKEPRIRVFHIENGGVSRARNYGIAQSSGEWLMFLDSDDYLLQDALKTLIDMATKTNTFISCANFYIEKDNRTVFCTGLRDGKVANNFRACYFQSICLCAGTTIYHRSILDVAMFDESLSRGEDVSSIYKLLRTYKLSYTDKCVMVYSLEDRGLSAKSPNRYKDHIFHMNFRGKSFWEKMLLGANLNDGFYLYDEYVDELKEKYADYLIFAKLDCKIRRFKRYKRILYKYIRKH